MIGLAQFIMRGRLQAFAIAVGGAGSLLFCWISAAAIALVTLRKGAAEGFWLFAWAVLPAGTLLYVFGDSAPLALLIGTLVLAIVLRETVSIALTLLASVGIGVLVGFAMVLMGGAYLEQLVEVFSQFLASVEQNASQGAEPLVLGRPTTTQVAGMLGSGTAVLSVISLLLGRYWQASLYNPGGFGAEFRALRYPVGLTLALVGAAVALTMLGTDYRTWAMIFVIPLSFAGLALVHARVAARGQGTGWLVWFYLAWVLLEPVKLAVVMFAVLDSWMDFRQRWAVGGPAGQPGSTDRLDDRSVEDKPEDEPGAGSDKESGKESDRDSNRDSDKDR